MDLNQLPSLLAIPSSTSVQIPGNGKGSMLTRIGAALNITAIVSATRVTLNSVAGLAAGNFVMTVDGYWGNIVSLPGGTDIIVDRWRRGGGLPNGTPAIANAALQAFPAGSVLAQCSGIVMREIACVAATAAATLDFFDYGTTALFRITTIAAPWRVEYHNWKLMSPFALQVSNTTTVPAHVLFAVVAQF